MNAIETKIAARSLTVTALLEALDNLGAVQFADASFAILQEVKGKEIWTEVSFKSKAATFDPFEVAEVWKEEVKAKAIENAEKAKAKAEKIARDKARREAKAKEKEAE